MLMIIGPTGSGKSTLARLVAERLGKEGNHPEIVSAGQWIRDRTGITDHGPEAAAQLAEASLEILRNDPDACLRWLHERTISCRGVIVEGIRNPRDFAHLFDPRRDGVVWLDGFPPRSAFEGDGLRAILTHLRWLTTGGILAPGRLGSLRPCHHHGLPAGVLDKAVQLAREAL